MARRAVFLDRDGTLNVERNYLHRIEDLELIPGTAAALARLKQAGWLLVVVTNQAGIARGFYDAAAVEKLHAHMAADLAHAGATIDGWYFCPHHPDFSGDCRCRKPAPGMLHDAERDLDIDLGQSWLVGDTLSDLAAGRAAGCRTLLVETGYGATSRIALADLPPAEQPAAVVADLAAAADLILTA